MATKLQCKVKEFTNIFHIADVHIRLTKRHDEYTEVFEKLYKAIERTPESTVVAVLGDLFHNKSDLSPECVKIASDFLQNLANRRPTVLIAGNHDATLANKNRLDSLTPIVDAVNHENLFYLKESGLFILGDILFNHFSIFDEHEKYVKYADIPKNYLNETRYNIVLFHGAVNDAITDVGYKVSSRTITNELFDGHQIALLGDIHRYQILQKYDDIEQKPCIVYAGSTIQQSHGEELKGHGFVYWNLKTKAFTHVEIPNDYGFYTVDLNKGVLVTDISDIPKKVRLRMKCCETVATEVKSILSEIRQVSEVIDVSYVRVDGNDITNKNIIDNTNLNINSVVDVDYQNTLISNFIKNKSGIDDKDVLEKIYTINKELNASLGKEQTVRNIRWKPKIFEFDNMFSYGEGNIIDFTKMHNVVGLFANNASGKSSILSALSFCIFDKCDRAFKASHVLNSQKMSFKCKFNFEVNGVDFFIERVGVADKKGNVKVDVKFWKDEGGKVIELNGEARRSTNDIIRDYVGTYDDFILTVLSIQNNKTGSFIDMGQTERKELLAQFMGLDIFDKLSTLSQEKSKEINVLIKNFKKNDYTQTLNNLTNIIETSSSLLTSETQSLEDLMTDRDVENNKLLEETKKLVSVDYGTENIHSLTQSETLYKNNILKLNNEISSSRVDYEKIESELSTLTLSEKTYLDNDTVKKYEEYVNVKREFSTKESQIERIKLVVNNKLEKLKTLEQHKYDPNCEFCTNNVFVKDAIKTKEELESDKANALVTFQEYTTLKNNVNSYGDIEQQYKNYKDIQIRKTNTENKLNKLNSNIVSSESKLLTEQTKLNVVLEKIEKFYKQKDVIESNEIIKSNIESIKSKIKIVDSNIKQKNTDIINLKTKLNSSIDQKNYIEKTIQEAKMLESKHEAYELYNSSVGRDGIPYELISQALPTIEKEVNNILSQIVEFTVSLQTDGKNVSTFINYEDKKWPLELSSGMEKFVSSLAIRVALINISNLPRPNFIAIDEGFGCADADNLSSMSTLFAFLKTNFDFVWVISHLDQMRDMVDNRIEIRKENGFSKVSFI